MQYTEGNVIDGRYVLEKLIGNGSFGEVWLAKDSQTDVVVAVKIYVAMDQQGLEDFRKEFQLSFNLNHTNLLHANYLGINTEDNRPFLVMPFCPQGSVSRRAGDMSEEEIWRFIKDVSAGLAYLHAQDPPIIHQDIKPDNILILQNGDYVVTDFGISKQLRRSMKRSASLNSAGAISYMGPERFSKNYQTIKASDIWSLGAAIFELATGELPFAGMGGSLQKQGAEIPEASGFSVELNTLISGCLAKETWDRPTAAQINEYAIAHLKGVPAKVTWSAPQPLNPSPSPTPAYEPAPVPPPVSAPLPSSDSSYGGFRGTHMEASGRVVPERRYYPAPTSPAIQKIPAWLYAVIALVGLVTGGLAWLLIM